MLEPSVLGKGAEMTDSLVRIGVVLPEVLGTYGDSGNAVVLRERARLRGIDAEIVPIPLGGSIPLELDIYTLGGGEDSAQAIAVEALRRDLGLRRAVESGRPLLAICASLQILGHWYEDAVGMRHDGLGLLDLVTVPQGQRSIGEIRVEPTVPWLSQTLTGFENHGGGTFLGADATPLGTVSLGRGNTTAEPPSDWAVSSADAVDGAVQGSIIATYMHGPVLARNPELADELLARAMGVEASSLAPLDIFEVTALRDALLN